MLPRWWPKAFRCPVQRKSAAHASSTCQQSDRAFAVSVPMPEHVLHDVTFCINHPSQKCKNIVKRCQKIITYMVSFTPIFPLPSRSEASWHRPDSFQPNQHKSITNPRVCCWYCKSRNLLLIHPRNCFLSVHVSLRFFFASSMITSAWSMAASWGLTFGWKFGKTTRCLVLDLEYDMTIQKAAWIFCCLDLLRCWSLMNITKLGDFRCSKHQQQKGHSKHLKAKTCLNSLLP